MLRFNIRKIAIACFVVAAIIGLATRLPILLDYRGFLGDQAIDAYAMADMKAGYWPALGPRSSVGNYSLPPAYYYMVYPFALFTEHPAAQVLPNSIASFVLIFLFAYVLHRYFLRRLEPNIRLLGAGLGALWLSLNYFVFGLGVGDWCPNTIPFFTLLVAIVCERILNHKGSWRRLLALWGSLGLIVGIMLGLHSITLFVMPVFFVLFCLYYLATQRSWRSVVGMILGGLMIGLTLVPYVVGELRTNFHNSRNIYHVVTSKDNAKVTIPDRIERMTYYQSEVTNRTLFAANEVRFSIVVAWLGLIPLLFLLALIRLNRQMSVLILGIWGLFLVVGSSYQGPMVMQYFLLGVFPPILLITAGIVRYWRKWGLVTALGTLLLAGLWLNVQAIYGSFHRAYTAPEAMSVEQKQQLLASISQDWVLCSPTGQQYAIVEFMYIDQYMRKNKHVYHNDCKPGDYVIMVGREKDPGNGFNQVRGEGRYSVWQKR